MTAPYIMRPRVDPEVAKSVGGMGFIDTLMALVRGAPASIDLDPRNRGAYLPRKDWMFLTPTEVDYGPEGGLAGYTQEQERGTLAHEFGHVLDAKSNLGSAGGDPEAFADAFALAVKNRVGRESMGDNYHVRQYRNAISNRQAHVADSVVAANMKDLPDQPRDYTDFVTAEAKKNSVPVHLALAMLRVSGGPASLADLRSHYDKFGSWEKALRVYNQGADSDPRASDDYVNRVRTALNAQIGRPAPSPISSAAREWLDRLALARHVLEHPERFTESERRAVQRRFDASSPR